MCEGWVTTLLSECCGLLNYASLVQRKNEEERERKKMEKRVAVVR